MKPTARDILRFPTEHFARISNELDREKYGERPADLVILVYIGNLGTAGKLLQQLFPGTPVIVAGFSEENISRDQFGSLIGIAQRVDRRATMEWILRLQPETRCIIVIGGTAEVDRSVLNRVKEAALVYRTGRRAPVRRPASKRLNTRQRSAAAN